MPQTEVTGVESFDEQDRGREMDGDKKPKSRRPANTAFRQQRLKAWQPILTPKSVLPLFFVAGIIFAPIGGLLIWASSQVQELVIDYTECAQKAPVTHEEQIRNNFESSFRSSKEPKFPTWQRSTRNDTNATICTLSFYIPEDIGPPVFMYYRLTNFYQNHRRYVQSLDLDQLKGKAVDNATINGSACDPLTVDPITNKAYYPCGLIANSLFNDSINSPVLSGANDGAQYVMTKKGIAWESDRELIKKTQYQSGQVVPPPNWQKRFPHGYSDKNLSDIHEDEDFMVWMRTAGLPAFSKLSGRNDTMAMASGTYQLEIEDHFPVTEYGGTKSILISTRTVIGGKNPFMGIAYVVVGGLCVVLGAVFTVAHLFRPRKLGDHTYLTWNTEQDSTVVATGREPRFGSHNP
ncbi:hypothetical protein ASPWEDRAFT_121391 [Aspergillus wentii DTO 134E9]|uniref:Cell cycle control protein n=1 Tax=Aspergillus wentii DTO 134E9 TaxID=1073089 RepID=A0A1L9R778_ASPWE|nr:uncharacterized protein ASPWEDRAFT_121391 [Aspergillus wentii DTO 134E9]OJJ30743.1 hypothetical protein ASPWEDRAFT_121391 [Aspergillus wentii DTO 134E9]